VYLHVRRLRQNEGVEQVITQLQLKTVKHSFMLPGRKINTAFVLNKATEQMSFDWGHATADLLCDDDIKKTIEDVIEVTTTSNSVTALTRTFSCKRLGMVEVTGAELGAAVNADPVLMDELRKALYIKTHAIWDGVMPDVTPEHNGHDAAAEEAEVDSDAGDDDALDIG